MCRSATCITVSPVNRAELLRSLSGDCSSASLSYPQEYSTSREVAAGAVSCVDITATYLELDRDSSRIDGTVSSRATGIDGPEPRSRVELYV